jgi:4-alpha-glucanotransferase
VSLELEHISSTEPVMIVRDDGAFRHERLWRGAGLAVPVFSLRSRESVGVGEFADIRKLVDLCSAAGATSHC